MYNLNHTTLIINVLFINIILGFISPKRIVLKVVPLE